LTSPNRNWSAAVQLTALDPRRRCVQCTLVVLNFLLLLAQSQSLNQRKFNPTWNAVGSTWTKVPREHRDNHFFATLEFDEAQSIFLKVCPLHFLPGMIHTSFHFSAWPHLRTSRICVSGHRRPTPADQR
jgi:hypothetical protein